MSLQKRTINTYRQLFPNETLREISLKTGIQITRVFRLMNGKTMKVSELEAFDQIINQKLASNPLSERLNSLIDEVKMSFGPEEFKKITQYIERKLHTAKLCRHSNIQNDDQALIA